jgi:tetratricopeptide (TPR) repeat protein
MSDMVDTGVLPLQADDTSQAIRFVCEKLTERKAVLFLGAGVNAGTKDVEGNEFLLGHGLAQAICRDLLHETTFNATLQHSSTLAEHKYSRPELNGFIYRSLSRFKPGIAHLALVQVPWDTIYTTNFDLLVEEASRSNVVQAAGRIVPFHSLFQEITGLSDTDIPYYKLHGTIDYANTKDGRLILTNEDYRHYEKYKKPLFKRLQQDVSTKTFIFIGYSLSDENFKKVLDDCREELDDRPFPASYAVLHNFTNTEAVYWKDIYNIQLLQYDGAKFLCLLKETWYNQNYSILTPQERDARRYYSADATVRFPRVGDSFFKIHPPDCSGQSSAKEFFRGAEPTWADIKEKVAPERDDYWRLFEDLLDDDTTSKVRTYIVTGAAGTGKTTLIYTLAFEMACSGYTVLVHIPGTPLDVRVLQEYVGQERLTVVIRNAAEYIDEIRNFISDLQLHRITANLILEERKNQWNYAIGPGIRFSIAGEYILGSLSTEEIDRVLKALDEHGCLGKLQNCDKEYQISHFTRLAEEDLLVALRELTSEETFDRIVKDEYEKIPTSEGKNAYVYIAAAGLLDVAVRYETIITLLDINYSQLETEVFMPTERVLISCEERGYSRHTLGFRLRTRHPVIASIIFDSAAPTDQEKFEVINDILSKLDPAQPEDRALFRAICQGESLIGTFSSDEKKRAVYEKLETVLPDNPFVFQHRSTLERRLNNSEQALKYARLAVAEEPDKFSFKNTLGMALVLSARQAKGEFERKTLLQEATKIFEKGIQVQKGDPYWYIGLNKVYQNEIENEENPEKRLTLEATALTLLEVAYENTDNSDKIASLLAEQKKKFQDSAEILVFLRSALKQNPNNAYIRDTLIRLEIDQKNYAGALKLALDGAKEDPTYWRFQMHIARLKATSNESLSSVQGHYEAAIRHNKSDLRLLVEYASFLFKKGLVKESSEYFNKAYTLTVTQQERTRFRNHWKDETGRHKVFTGTVKSFQGMSGLLTSIPENFDVFFWKNQILSAGIFEKSLVTFNVAFVSRGPIAYNIKRKA